MLFSPKVLKEVEKARELNIKKMNEFVNFLLKEGYDVRGIETEGIFDIDTMDVLEEAEKYFSG